MDKNYALQIIKDSLEGKQSTTDNPLYEQAIAFLATDSSRLEEHLKNLYKAPVLSHAECLAWMNEVGDS